MFVPKALKKWIAIFRGEVAPVLILLSVMFGFWFGLMPGFYGLHVALLVVVLVLNVHFGIFMIFVGIGKGLAFAAAPVLYHLGVGVVGRAGGLLELLATIPVIGATDFSRFALAGALVAGPVVGLILGILLSRSVTAFRRTCLKLEEGSDAFRRWQEGRWTGFLTSFLIGKGSKDVRGVLERRAKMVRIPGVVLAVVVLALVLVGVQFMPVEKVRDYASRSLTSANGAEVNLQSLDLNLLGGRISAAGIEATDPANPANNRFAVAELSADVSLLDLLRGRLVLDEVSLVDVKTDAPRVAPGQVMQGAVVEETAAAPFEPGRFSIPEADVGDIVKLESYFKDAGEIREHLQTVRDYLPKGAGEAKPQPGEAPQRYLECLTVRAAAAPTPRLLIRRLLFEDIDVPFEQLGKSNIECRNLSDAPAGAGVPVEIDVQSTQQKSSLKLVCAYDKPGGGAELEASFEDVDLRKFQNQLKDSNSVTFESGTASASVSGTLGRDTVDLAIKVKLKDLKANAGGALFGLDPQISSEAMKVLAQLETTLRVVGPTTEPRLVFDSSALGTQLRDALVNAGKAELARRATELLGDKMPGGVPDPAAVLTSPEAATGALEGLLGGKKKDKQEDEDEKDKSEAKDSVKDSLGGLLKGKRGDKEGD